MTGMTVPSVVARARRVVQRTARREHWRHYNVFAGTNTWRECAIAVTALAGRGPLAAGPDIERYEQRFADVTGARQAVSFASGRMGLYAILEAMGIGDGDEVILPAFTCVVVPNAVRYRGARPVYADIDRRTYNLDVASVARRVTARTRAIIAQHTFGLVCDVDGIADVAARHGLFVIEDAAHALGASLRARRVGSLGHAAFFSTDHSKVVSTGTGGMVTTSEPELAERLRRRQAAAPFADAARIRAILAMFALEFVLFHPRVCALGRLAYRALDARRKGAYFLDELLLARPTAYPYPARLSNPQARIGLRQLDGLAENLVWRRRLAALYDAELGVYREGLEPAAANHAFLRYTFLAEDRTAWIRHFEDVVDLGIWFTSVAHGRTRGLEDIGYERGSCPVAEDAASRCVNLPTHPRIVEPELFVERIRRARTSCDPRFGLRDARHPAPAA